MKYRACKNSGCVIVSVLLLLLLLVIVAYVVVYPLHVFETPHNWLPHIKGLLWDIQIGHHTDLRISRFPQSKKLRDYSQFLAGILLVRLRVLILYPMDLSQDMYLPIII